MAKDFSLFKFTYYCSLQKVYYQKRQTSTSEKKKPDRHTEFAQLIMTKTTRDWFLNGAGIPSFLLYILGTGLNKKSCP